MDERLPLIKRDNSSLQQKKISHKSEYTKAKLSLFVMINYFAIEFAGLTQPQYIYSYLENARESNNTSVDMHNNISSNHLNNCFNKSSSSADESREQASSWTWYISLAEYGVAFPVLFYIGPLTDRIGRKPLLLYNTVMVFIAFVLKTIVVYGRFPLQYYVAASAIEGLAGTPFAFNLINHAIIADTTTLGNDRPLMMMVYDALLGLGAICSNIGTGYLIQLLGFTYLYLASSGLLLILPILILFTLEETWKPPKEKSKTSVFKLPIKNLTLCFKRQHVSNKLGYFIANLFILLLVLFPYTSISSILTLFLLGEPFCWTSEHIGWYNAGVDFVKYIGGTTMLKIMHSCCVWLKDEIIIVFAMLSSIAYLILMGFSNNDWMVYGAGSAAIFRVLSIPLLKATLSRKVNPTKQGVMFSNVYLFEVLSVLSGTTVFNNIYRQTLNIYRGFIFFVMAGFPVCGLILMGFVSCFDSTTIQKELVIEKVDIQVPSSENDVKAVQITQI